MVSPLSRTTSIVDRARIDQLEKEIERLKKENNEKLSSPAIQRTMSIGEKIRTENMEKEVEKLRKELGEKK